jgi:predicted metal-dependent HD superfamily phosphohydrolase
MIQTMTLNISYPPLPQRYSDIFKTALIERFGIDEYGLNPNHPTLHYHNLRHIAEMNSHLQLFDLPARDFELVEDVIWAHDFIYDTASLTNEYDSWLFAKRHIKWGDDYDDLFHDLIMVTKNHRVPPYLKFRNLFRMVIDLDVQILSAGHIRYREYAEGIRQEYHIVPDIQYRSGRIKVLEHIIASPDLLMYLSIVRDLHPNELGDIARSNMEREIAALKLGGTIAECLSML